MLSTTLSGAVMGVDSLPLFSTVGLAVSAAQDCRKVVDVATRFDYVICNVNLSY